jgi:hypothetical protein
LHRTYRYPVFILQRSPRRVSLALRIICILTTVTVLQCLGIDLWDSRHLEAQQTTEDNIIATTLFETKFDGPPPGPATISVATISLAPGQASLPLEGSGALLILVESGSVTLTIDQVIDGLAPVDDSDNASGPGVMYRLRAGQRVTLPDIGTIQFRNEGDATSNLLLLTLMSEGGTWSPGALVSS